MTMIDVLQNALSALVAGAAGLIVGSYINPRRSRRQPWRRQ
jgi:hypothetical protein